VETHTRILIVEDEELLAENIRDFLLRRGFQVEYVGSGEAALDRMAYFVPQLLVLDYGLPGMNGLETLRALRVQQPDVGAILITGHPSEEVIQAAADVGIRHVLSKPFSFSELTGIVLTESVHPTTTAASDDRRMSGLRRNGDRRNSNGSAPSLPLGTVGGWISQEQRHFDRRRVVDRRSPALDAAGGPELPSGIS